MYEITIKTTRQLALHINNSYGTKTKKSKHKKRKNKKNRKIRFSYYWLLPVKEKETILGGNQNCKNIIRRCSDFKKKRKIKSGFENLSLPSETSLDKKQRIINWIRVGGCCKPRSEHEQKLSNDWRNEDFEGEGNDEDDVDFMMSSPFAFNNQCSTDSQQSMSTSDSPDWEQLRYRISSAATYSPASSDQRQISLSLKNQAILDSYFCNSRENEAKHKNANKYTPNKTVNKTSERKNTKKAEHLHANTTKTKENNHMLDQDDKKEQKWFKNQISLNLAPQQNVKLLPQIKYDNKESISEMQAKTLPNDYKLTDYNSIPTNAKNVQPSATTPPAKHKYRYQTKLNVYLSPKRL